MTSTETKDPGSLSEVQRINTKEIQENNIKCNEYTGWLKAHHFKKTVGKLITLYGKDIINSEEEKSWLSINFCAKFNGKKIHFNLGVDEFSGVFRAYFDVQNKDLSALRQSLIKFIEEVNTRLRVEPE